MYVAAEAKRDQQTLQFVLFLTVGVLKIMVCISLETNQHEVQVTESAPPLLWRWLCVAHAAAWVASSSRMDSSCTHLQLSTSALLLTRSPLLPGHGCAQAADLFDCRHCALGIQQLLPLSGLHGVQTQSSHDLRPAGPVQITLMLWKHCKR